MMNLWWIYNMLQFYGQNRILKIPGPGPGPGQIKSAPAKILPPVDLWIQWNILKILILKSVLKLQD